MARTLKENRLRIPGVLVAILIFSNVITVYASIPELQDVDKQGQDVRTDDMLEKIAVEKGIIPKDADEAFLKVEIEKKNTITTWIMIDVKSRLSIIDNMRELNKKDGIIIRLPSEYYVREIAGDIYNSIVKGDVGPTVVRGLGNIFRTIAIMEGDYDNGKDKVAVAKEYMGEDMFQQYKSMYPEKYEKLIMK